MKKLFLLLAAILSLQCAMAQNVDVFVKGGIGMSDWIGKESDELDPKFSYRIGAGLDIPIKGIWGFRTGLGMSSIGTKAHAATDEMTSAWDFEMSMKTTQIYLELPLMATVSFDVTDNMRCTVGAGPYFAIGVGGKSKADVTWGDGTFESDKANTFGETDEDTESMLKRFDAGLGLDVNFEVKHLIFGLDTRFGLYKFYQDDFFDEIEKYKVYNFSTCVVVGYRF